jgi:hypothetical protein
MFKNREDGITYYDLLIISQQQLSNHDYSCTICPPTGLISFLAYLEANPKHHTILSINPSIGIHKSSGLLLKT